MTDAAPALPAFAEFLSISASRDADGWPICEIAPGDTAMGRPSAMHGGAVATLLEQAGHAAASAALAPDDGTGSNPAITLVSMTVDYLRAGPMRPCCARGDIVKTGGKVINIAVKGWAEDPAKPFAAARLTYLIER